MMFGDKILKYKDELLADLNTLIGFESVANEKPEECQNAINFMLKRANDFGLTGEQVTDESMHIQLGSKGKLCGILSHLDVVPAGNNWSVLPYSLTEKDGRLYGRGIADDKGAALVTLYCLRALKEEGIDGVNALRAIYGTSEECGMEDIDGYFEKMPVPDLSFTPDSDYGICYAEKGILQIEVSTKGNLATVLSQLHSGKAINAVPDIAYALLDSSNYDEQNLLELSKKTEGNFEFNSTIDGLMVISRGKAAHACEPHKGFNAAAALVELLAKAYTSTEIGTICDFIDIALGNETDGCSLGLKTHCSISGDLTVNLGYIHIEGNEARAAFDIRYPVSITGGSVYRQFRYAAKHNKLDVKVLNHEKPLYIEKDSELVKLLSGAYKAVTGEEPELYTTGGGTYARKLGGKGLAFGPAFKDDEVNMHNADESIDKEKFFTHAQICLEAMYRMYCGISDNEN
ncbi:Sapep family Mn(2+)-dependent dipeptidase [Ruminococcus intestinalis]|uniref:Sapep family Mn(2+)-dependent dipeptidase n=1 Tax=Ruminococcus intestinalis TaxID=2763066 RepID=UPI003F7EEC4A